MVKEPNFLASSEAEFSAITSDSTFNLLHFFSISLLTRFKDKPTLEAESTIFDNLILRSLRRSVKLPDGDFAMQD